MTKTLYPLFGLVTVLITPFKAGGAIDLGALRKNVREALAAGVAGFLVPAMASEVASLSHPERIKMVETVLEEVNQEVPVITGARESKKAEELFVLILSILAFFKQHLEISIHFFKRLLYHLGPYPSPLVRKPALPFDAYHEKKAHRLIQTVIDLENQIKNQLKKWSSLL